MSGIVVKERRRKGRGKVREEREEKGKRNKGEFENKVTGKCFVSFRKRRKYSISMINLEQNGGQMNSLNFSHLRVTNLI